MGKEKRIIPRVVSINLVSTERKDGAGQVLEAFMGRTLNISEGGILLEVSNSYPMSSEIEITIAMGDDLIRATGRVVHLRELAEQKVGVGIKFLQLAEEDRKKLVAYSASTGSS